MGMHRSGWFSYLGHDDKQDKPVITRELLARVKYQALRFLLVF